MNELTPLENALLVTQFDDEEDARRRSEWWQAGNRLWKIMMLAPTIEICEAMLRGEAVPVDRLDPEWVRRFGRRNQLRRAA